jgi:ferrous iron transport protein B
MIIGAFFAPAYQPLVMLALYFLGIFVGILFALLLGRTRFRGEPVPFVMELPNYRIPSMKSVGRLIWDKAKGFLVKAFTIIFAASVIIWFLQMFNSHMNVAAGPEDSLLAAIGRFAAPVFAPLGFDDWRVATALITGFSAKETVVSTLTVLMGGDVAELNLLFTPLTAMVFLVFTLLYTPCIAAIATVRREVGGRNAMATVVTQCVIAWLVAYVVHLLGTLLGLS